MSVTVPGGYKQTKVGVIPEDWEVVRLGNVSNIYDSLHKTPKEYHDSGYPMVRVVDVKYGILDLSNTLKVDKRTFDEFSKKEERLRMYSS